MHAGTLMFTHTCHVLIRNGDGKICIMRSLMICRMRWITIMCNETWENETNLAFNLHEGEDKCPQCFGEVA